MARRAINLMRYQLVIVDDNGQESVLPPSGQTINVNEYNEMTVTDFDNLGHVPVATIVSKVDQVPSPMDDIAYIIPMRALLALHEQGYDTSDMYAPNMLVKDNTGRVTGCRRLMQLPKAQKR
jgi:hypothetical protein